MGERMEEVEVVCEECAMAEYLRSASGGRAAVFCDSHPDGNGVSKGRVPEGSLTAARLRLADR